jgi:ABC-type sugar transport system permease subunit
MRKRFASWFDENASWAMLLPTALVVGLLLLLPAVTVFGISLLAWCDSGNWSLLSDKDFVAAIDRTFLYAFATVSVQLVIGLFAATTLVRVARPRLAMLLGLLIFLPYAIPCGVTALIWQLLCRTNGLLARVMAATGLAPNVQWLYSGSGLLLTLIIASI